MDNTCFDNYIGIREYCKDGSTPVPYSGLYIDDVPGFTLSKLATFANLEHVETPQELFYAKLNLAIAHVKKDFLWELRKRFKVRSAAVREFREIGVYERNEFNAPENIQRGVVIENKIYKAQKLTKLKITEVTLWARPSGNTFISIIDGDNVTNYPITVDAYGPVTIKLDHYIENDYAFIVADNSLLETYYSDVYSRNNPNYYLSCISCCDSGKSDVYMFGWDGNTRSSNTYGISVKALLYCDLDDFWCSLKDVLDLSILYKLAYLLIEEGIFGTRQNFINDENPEQDYMNYLRAEYLDKLKIAVGESEILAKTIDKFCLPCYGAYMTLSGV